MYPNCYLLVFGCFDNNRWSTCTLISIYLMLDNFILNWNYSSFWSKLGILWIFLHEIFWISKYLCIMIIYQIIATSQNEIFLSFNLSIKKEKAIVINDGNNLTLNCVNFDVSCIYNLEWFWWVYRFDLAILFWVEGHLFI